MTPPPVAEWPGAEIAPGVAFQGDGSVTLAEGPGGLPVLTFWRPILFREDSDKPIAGRMDCRVVASEGLYSEEVFDPEALHEVNEPLREAQGYKDRDILRDLSETVRKIDVVGRRKDPREHYVLSYILVRDGDRLIDIRRNCTFIHGKGIRRIDALPYVHRYTKLTYAFEPNTGNNA
ncbi:carbamoyl-phosphate synthase large subunit [Erythrobacter rubeus]|uniref:Carbamoyl-phosphate synthase large subunit n=1 Tax=Erythrobacter rubeus TaxID=2760803 RepID=A0ABR8KQV3_9SPHN|nr:carbamoyl-phosphate synthase large subunit [Erythrobacter rubeus]MBD2841920.1 carbamoyl-phosphate synthase large subunit [Erythrobacter rubeus]